MDRQQKIAKLNAKRLNKEKAEAKKLEQTAQTLEDAVNNLKKAFDVGVEVNGLDQLIDQIAEIKTFKNSVEELREAIKSMPETVKVEDIDGIVDAIKSIEIKAPDVVMPKKKEVDIISLTAEIISAINKLANQINKSKPKEQGQDPKDFIPYRRVIKVGNALVYDDLPHTTGGFGGGSSVPTVGGYVPVVNPDGSLIGSTSPTDGYGYCAKSTTATYKYYFFENKDGDWYILRKTIATEVVDYAVGTGGYDSVFNSSTTDPDGSPTFGSFATIFS